MLNEDLSSHALESNAEPFHEVVVLILSVVTFYTNHLHLNGQMNVKLAATHHIYYQGLDGIHKANSARSEPP